MPHSNVIEVSVLPTYVVEKMFADVSKHLCYLLQDKTKKPATNSAPPMDSKISLWCLQLPAGGHYSD
jgi:hypothetical protein